MGKLISVKRRGEVPQKLLSLFAETDMQKLKKEGRIKIGEVIPAYVPHSDYG